MDSFTGFVDAVARTLFWVGLGALVVGVAMLLWTLFSGSSGSPQVLEQSARNIELFGKLALIGGLAAAIAVTWQHWGEETLGVLVIIVGAGLYFVPTYLPGIASFPTSETAAKALTALSLAGLPIGIIGLAVVLIDLVGRVRTRVNEGARADQLKFGKGLKEERDIRNVFLGKCWQLPYCRKFVRERCPIYHARRTCWQERVGCMCEESVIQNAMEGKVIPSDVVAAAKFIPRNSKLTPGQKAERCRQCVIYNEHQKHKYQLSLPGSAAALVALYFAIHTPMKAMIQGWLVSADSAMGEATFRGQDLSQTTSVSTGVIPYAEIILIAMFLIVFAYIVRVLEFLFFKLKV
jgi:hypothetical protein